MSDKSLNTKILNTPFPENDAYKALNMPVYHAAAFEFETAEEMELAFIGKSPKHTYSRIANPTVQYFEERIKSLTGAFSVTAMNSGMAAITNAIITVAKAGGNIVTSKHLFGNTYSFFAYTLAEFGVEPRFCDLTDFDEVRNAIDDKTCAVFLEIITNPQMEVVDLAGLSEITREKGTPLIADTTIVPFGSFKAASFGVDIEIVSTTKYVSGGATSLGGVIIDYASFDWTRSLKLSSMSKQFGSSTFTAKLRKEIHRNFGACMDSVPNDFFTDLLCISVRRECRFNGCVFSYRKFIGLAIDSAG